MVVDCHQIIVSRYKTIVNRHGTIADGQVVSWHELHNTVDISKNFVDESGTASRVWVEKTDPLIRNGLLIVLSILIRE